MTTPEERAEILAEMEAVLGQPPTVDELIAAASAPEHPLHDDFEWDDSIAGHHWRQNQARAIFRTVEFIRVTRDIKRSCVKYVRNPDAKHQQSYINIEHVTPKSREAHKILQMHFARIRSHLTTARAVAAVLGLEAELLMFLEALVELERKASINARKQTPKKPTKPHK